MTITELIIKLELIRGRHGDLDVFDANFHDGFAVQVEDDNSHFDKDWNMPEKFVVLGSGG